MTRDDQEWSAMTSDEQMTEQLDKQMTRDLDDFWLDDKMAKLCDKQMTRNPGKEITNWLHDQMTRWKDDQVTNDDHILDDSVDDKARWRTAKTQDDRMENRQDNYRRLDHKMIK